MDCWHRNIERSSTEAEVVGSAADFMSLWSPRELGREVTIESADDLERVRNTLFEDVGCSRPLRDLEDYLWHASQRIREIRSV